MSGPSRCELLDAIVRTKMQRNRVAPLNVPPSRRPPSQSAFSLHEISWRDLLRRAGVSGWPRLLQTVKLKGGRASRQTELQREFPLHVVCSWLGNSPRIAQQSYLLVTEDDFARAAGVAKVMVEGSFSVKKPLGF